MQEDKKINLLIVEDHALTLFGLKTVLATKDFVREILEAQNATKALAILEKKNVDIAIVDLGLPDINGIELTLKIKSISPKTKIIILTSHEKQEEVVACFRNGANAYCSKEIDTKILSEVIEHVNLGAIWIDPVVASIIREELACRNTLKEKSATTWF